MRGQRALRAAKEAQTECAAPRIIDVSMHEPRRTPSSKWRELIKKVWEADPLSCPKCFREMRIISLINECEVIRRILSHLGIWAAAAACATPARDPPVIRDRILEPWLDDPFPDYDSEPVMEYADC